MFKCEIIFKSEWVLEHRSEKPLPVEKLNEKLKKYIKKQITLTFTQTSFLFEPTEMTDDKLDEILENMFKNEYGGMNYGDVVKITVSEYREEQEEESKTSDDDEDEEDDADDDEDEEDDEELLDEDGEEAGDFGDLDALLDMIDEDCKDIAKNFSKPASAHEKIKSLVGAGEFKALADEIVGISEEIIKNKTFDIFNYQSYVFSINDGYGLTTCLSLFKDLIKETGITKVRDGDVLEYVIDPPKDATNPFERVLMALRRGTPQCVQMLCVDISEWLNSLNSKVFKNFLRSLEKSIEGNIVIFRVPFLDKDVLEDVRYSINDLLYVKTVSFAPLDRAQIKLCASEQIKNYGFSISNSAWEFFNTRIAEEKSDGKFYGLNTVKKVVRELLYKKQLKNAKAKTPNKLISKNDAREICGGWTENNQSGSEMLNALVANQRLKERLNEVLAQIELAVRQSEKRPCIHMRFVGNPGTGKTTIARILGKLLKEKGVLRIGAFHEYAGRDFVGRYIGETAPKTAGICREAYGSVLFIDEAYSLYRGKNNEKDFGREAIDTLIAEMENHRSDLVVIMAGYTEEMNLLMESNPGLASRMPYTIEFPNFTREELYSIFETMARKKFKISDDLLPSAKEYFDGLPDEVINSKDFANARFVRNVFERTWAKAALRIQLGGISQIVLCKDDFERAVSDKEFTFNKKPKTKMGF